MQPDIALINVFSTMTLNKGTLKNQLIADVVLAIVALAVGAATDEAGVATLPSTASGYLNKSIGKLGQPAALKSLGLHWSEQCQLTLTRVVRTAKLESKPEYIFREVNHHANTSQTLNQRDRCPAVSPILLRWLVFRRKAALVLTR